jgi:eukaryotic-like serine/threonine-protein kinase
MNAESTCPRCHEPLGPGRLGGLCPKCIAQRMVQVLQPATRIRYFGDYELLEEMGRGGMGVVYKARQVSLDRLLALKLILSGHLAGEEEVRRFHTEAAAAANLEHPNIVAIHETGEHEGQHYFSMQLIEGVPLTDLADIYRQDPRRSARLLRKVAGAVHHAHQRGILHRDLKPGNILVDDQDEPHLTDFGLAKRVDLPGELTRTDTTLGTPDYMSPEQAQGHHRLLTTASDVWSLGAVLYDLLTGRPPLHRATPWQTMEAVVKDQPVRPRLLNPAVPRDLETICLKCLEKEPGKRYGSAEALAQDLGRFLEGQSVLCRPVSRVGETWRWCRRQPVRAALAGALILTLVLGSAGVLWQWQRAEQEGLAARQVAYVLAIRSAQHALEANDLGEARSLLDQCQPTKRSVFGRSPDLRHWEWRYLREQCRGDEWFALGQYSLNVESLRVSSDGKFLAVRIGLEHVGIWDWAASRCLAELHAPAPRWARNLAFLPGTSLLAVGTVGPNDQPELMIWDANLSLEKERFPIDETVQALAISPDGKWLGILHIGGDVTVMDFASKQVRRRYPAKLSASGDCGDLTFSRDGSRLIVGQFDGRILVREWRTDAEPLEIPCHDHPFDGVKALACSPTDDLIALATTNIWLWNYVTGTPLGELPGHSHWIAGLEFSPDGQWLASVAADRSVRLWDVARRTQARRLQGHVDEVWSLAYLPDGETLVTGGKDGSILFWKTRATWRPPTDATLPEPNRGRLTFTPDGQSFITVGANRSVRLWNTHPLRELEQLSFLGPDVLGVAFSGDGRWLAAAEATGNLKVWDWNTRRVITNLVIPQAGWAGVGFTARSGFLTTRTALGAQGWETQSWQSIPNAPDFKRLRIQSVSLSPTERQWASGHENGTVTLWTFPASKQQAEFSAHSEAVNELAFSPDGDLIVSASDDGYVHLFNVPAPLHLGGFRAHYNSAGAVCFSPDGQRLVTGGRTLKEPATLWDLATRRTLISLKGQGRSHVDLVFSPDGNTLVGLDNDGNVDLWHAPTLAELEAAERSHAPPGPQP